MIRCLRLSRVHRTPVSLKEGERESHDHASPHPTRSHTASSLALARTQPGPVLVSSRTSPHRTEPPPPIPPAFRAPLGTRPLAPHHSHRLRRLHRFEGGLARYPGTRRGQEDSQDVERTRSGRRSRQTTRRCCRGWHVSRCSPAIARTGGIGLRWTSRSCADWDGHTGCACAVRRTNADRRFPLSPPLPASSTGCLFRPASLARRPSPAPLRTTGQARTAMQTIKCVVRRTPASSLAIRPSRPHNLSARDRLGTLGYKHTR